MLSYTRPHFQLPSPEMAEPKSQQNLTLPPIRSLFFRELALVKPQKAHRIRLTRHQLSVLAHAFDITPYPDTDARNALSALLHIAPRTVQIWFQNKRQACRKIESSFPPVS
ncbi:hypothetical protein DSO57_1002224 [Entomophthora muscae]|uniref:Uncharacterized protein n=2 Tax=Entomophthora muscae TaxID=34485 RepID=A0ACC2RIZ4_9FUNG|nr:hypothetical protein DSO57_1018722 [Entomophthora muscae]KAJ9082707.1 hypothetical protein DSO57_1002224 [Entomophthora muscae]